MIIQSGPSYDDFQAIVDEFDSALTLDAVYYITDGTNVQQAWAFLNAGNGDVIAVSSSVFDPGSTPANATFTTDFSGAISVTQPLEVK